MSNYPVGTVSEPLRCRIRETGRHQQADLAKCLVEASARLFLFSLPYKPGHVFEGFRANVVLNSFGVRSRRLFSDSEGKQKLIDDLMAAETGVRQLSSAVREFEWFVLFDFHQAVALESPHGADDGDVTNAEVFGEVCDATHIVFIDDMSDGFNVVFGKLCGMVIANSLILMFAAELFHALVPLMLPSFVRSPLMLSEAGPAVVGKSKLR